MTYLELRDKLEVISNLTNANATDIDNIIKVYTTLYGNDIYICRKCPATIRVANNKLLLYYKENKEYINNNLNKTVCLIGKK